MTASTLGVAILGCPSASLLLPDLWRTALLNEYLDGNSRLAVFRTCRSDRDWVWQGSETATLTCDLDGEPHALLSRMCAARQWLSNRTAAHSTRLSLKQTTANLSSVLLALATLQQATHLTFDGLHLYDHVQCTALLSALATSCSHLTSLHLGRLHGALPQPALLPHLTDLSAKYRSYPPPPLEASQSVQRLLPQLISLDVQWGLHHIAQSFITSPAPRLRTLNLHNTCTDEVLSLLLQHAPQLENVTFDDVQLQSDQHAEATWNVHRMSVQYLERGMHYLPHSQHPDFTLSCDSEGGGWISVEASDTGVDPRVLTRLQQWRWINFRELEVEPDDAVSPEQHSTALGAVLQQLTLVSAALADWSVHLGTGWAWDAQLLQQVSTHTAPTLLPHLCVDINELTDTSLDLLLQHGRGIPALSVQSVSLAADHSHRTLPWSSVGVQEQLSAQALLHMPLGPEGRLEVEFVRIVSGVLNLLMGDGQITEGWVDKLVARLQHFHFTAVKDHGSYQVPVVCPAGLPAERQPAVLRAHLQVLCAVSTDPTAPELRLEGWTYSSELIAVLAGAPQWCRELSLEGVWSAGRGECCCLGRELPVTYKSLRLYDVSQSQVVDVLVGLSQRQDWRQGLNIRVKDEGVVKHVTPYLRHLGLEGPVTCSAYRPVITEYWCV